MQCLGVLFDGSQPSRLGFELAVRLAESAVAGALKLYCYEQRNKTYTPVHFGERASRQYLETKTKDLGAVKLLQDWKVVARTHEELKRGLEVSGLKTVILGEYGRKGRKEPKAISGMLRKLLFQSKFNICVARRKVSQEKLKVVFCYDGSQAATRLLSILKLFANCEIRLLLAPFPSSTTFLNSLRKKLTLIAALQGVNAPLEVLEESEDDELLLERLNSGSEDLVIVGKQGEGRAEGGSGFGRTCAKIALHCNKNVLILE